MAISKKTHTEAAIILLFCLLSFSCFAKKSKSNIIRQRNSINEGWKFYKYASGEKTDSLIYDVRPPIGKVNDSKDADTKPTEGINAPSTNINVLKAYILPTSNEFIQDVSKRYTRPSGNPGKDFPFVQADFDDSSWENVTLPHDWAIKGPFYEGDNPVVGGGMGRLPSAGVAWYRRKIDISKADQNKSVYLDIDGAMSYSMVWLNGHLVGGWAYGYNSYRLDLTPFLNFNGENQLAIRLDNPNYSERWYMGGGLYRDVWLVRTNKIQVSHWGTQITTTDVSKQSAKVNITISVDNNSDKDSDINVITSIYALDEKGKISGNIVSSIKQSIKLMANTSVKVSGTGIITKPQLWGPPPTQKPNLYRAVTTLASKGMIVDKYESDFGIRKIEFNPEKGILINDELIKIQGVNQHHDLGAIGTAWNTRAAERQLEILKEMGCNAIRLSHNPPAPELLELTDKMGFLVIDEVFDSWERMKNPYDIHLIFPDWHEQDLRAMIRRDKNHPSVILWSIGNEVGEQYTDQAGAKIALNLKAIVKSEDPTRPITASANWAKADFPFIKALDVISLNYQGEGIRQDPFFNGTERIQTPPSYDTFHSQNPDKVVLTSESATAASSRGIYLFPVYGGESTYIRDGHGGDSKIAQVSSYELYAVDFGSSADKVFKALDTHPFVAGEFVWNGFDYIGEPTPYYQSKSSYTGIIDLAGFPKDRYYLYQSHWRPDLKMVHILPHWNWSGREGKTTPIQVFTSGDEVELFLNGKSLGKKRKGEYEYRLRWDSVAYEPGTVKAIAYKNGKFWTEETVHTTGKPAKLVATADRNTITADGKDLSYITVKVVDENGLTVPNATNLIKFSLEGEGEIIATDNGDAYCFTPFSSTVRKAFSGLCLGIVRSKKDKSGAIKLKVESDGLESCEIKILTTDKK